MAATVECQSWQGIMNYAKTRMKFLRTCKVCTRILDSIHSISYHGINTMSKPYTEKGKEILLSMHSFNLICLHNHAVFILHCVHFDVVK